MRSCPAWLPAQVLVLRLLLLLVVHTAVPVDADAGSALSWCCTVAVTANCPPKLARVPSQRLVLVNALVAAGSTAAAAAAEALLPGECAV